MSKCGNKYHVEGLPPGVRLAWPLMKEQNVWDGYDLVELCEDCEKQGVKITVQESPLKSAYRQGMRGLAAARTVAEYRFGAENLYQGSYPMITVKPYAVLDVEKTTRYGFAGYVGWQCSSGIGVVRRRKGEHLSLPLSDNIVPIKSKPVPKHTVSKNAIFTIQKCNECGYRSAHEYDFKLHRRRKVHQMAVAP